MNGFSITIYRSTMYSAGDGNTDVARCADYDYDYIRKNSNKLTAGSPFISPQVALTVKGPCVSSSTSSPSSRISEKYML